MKAQTAREMEIKKQSYDEGVKDGQSIAINRCGNYINKIRELASVESGKVMKVNDFLESLDIMEKNIRATSNDE